MQNSLEILELESLENLGIHKMGPNLKATLADAVSCCRCSFGTFRLQDPFLFSCRLRGNGLPCGYADIFRLVRRCVSYASYPNICMFGNKTFMLQHTI